MTSRIVAAALAAALAVGCAGHESEAQSASAQNKASATPRYSPPDDPYPSTYRVYPGTLTAITGATIFDGEGGRIDNGTIVLAEGRVQAIGGADTPIPEGATRIDGAGRWVTPGVIDIHSHLGDYPSPGVQAHSDGNEVTSPVRPSRRVLSAFWISISV